jgi:hypothetical protein
MALPLIHFYGTRQADHNLYYVLLRPLSECSGDIAFR